LQLPNNREYFEVRRKLWVRVQASLGCRSVDVRKAVRVMSLALEARKEQVKGVFDRVEEIEDVVEKLAEREPEAVARLQQVASEALASAGPIPLSVAAELLQLSPRTITTWANEGVLRVVAHKPKQVDPVQLHQVKHLVEELRAAGRNRDLVTAVWYRLQDQAALDREDLAESLEQFRRGEKIPL
jgi:hypothetical protein